MFGDWSARQGQISNEGEVLDSSYSSAVRTSARVSYVPAGVIRSISPIKPLRERVRLDVLAEEVLLSDSPGDSLRQATKAVLITP